MNQAWLHPSTWGAVELKSTKRFTTACALKVPTVAPIPLVIMIKRPCALERIDKSVSLSTNNEPEKSNATPYTNMERTNIQTPSPGSPKPNKPNRSTQAIMAINITRLIPKRPKKKGISKIQHVSLTWDNEINRLACCTPNVFAYSGMALKLVINGFVKPFVICSETPNSIEKIKNIAILRSLKSRKAFNPKASTKDLCPPFPRLTGHSGSVQEYIASTTPQAAQVKNCM